MDYIALILGLGAGAIGCEIYRRRLILPLRARITSLEGDNKQLAEKLSKEQLSLALISATMQEGLVVVNSRHEIRHANEAFRTIFQAPEEPLGRTILESVRVAEVEQLVDEVFASRNPKQIDISIVLPGKKPVWLSVSAAPSQKGDAAVLIFHDITRLREAEEMRKEFVANVSHELRTPLSIFQGYVETLIDLPSISEQERQEMLQVMARHSQRLNAIVSDLLTLGRLDSSHGNLRMEEISLAQFLRQLQRDWTQQAEAKQIELQFEVPAENAKALADAGRLEQVLSNLLENALKYTPSGGTVLAGATVSADSVRLFVQDNGPGIPPADLPHIFDRFYRVDKSRSREEGGTGLGLSIVKQIAELHRGSVSAESVFGKGTTITVTLPGSSSPPNHPHRSTNRLAG